MAAIFYEQSAERHERRAEFWLSVGRPDYAEGSMAKAARWRQRVRSVDLMLHGPFPKTRLDALVSEVITSCVQKISGEIEREMLHGR